MINPTYLAQRTRSCESPGRADFPVTNDYSRQLAGREEASAPDIPRMASSCTSCAPMDDRKLTSTAAVTRDPDNVLVKLSCFRHPHEDPTGV